MHSRRRALRLVVLTCLVATVLAATALPAEARKKHLDLHRGSRGHTVTVLEARLARIGLLPRSAVDRRYRAATVKAVKRFQRSHGLRANGRTNRRTWNSVYTAYSRAIAPRPAPAWVPPSWAAPGITAHRGGSSEAPENTLASIKHGVAVGADVVEFDVRTTSDGAFVLMHDATLDRTTNCSGAVSSRTLAQLASCRTDRGQQPIATFDEVASYLASTSGVDLAPELKDTGTTALTDAELDRFVATLEDNELAGRTYVQSFDPAVFPRVRARDADLKLVWLSNSVLYVSAVKARGVDVASVNMDALARQNVARLPRARCPDLDVDRAVEDRPRAGVVPRGGLGGYRHPDHRRLALPLRAWPLRPRSWLGGDVAAHRPVAGDPEPPRPLRGEAQADPRTGADLCRRDRAAPGAGRGRCRWRTGRCRAPGRAGPVPGRGRGRSTGPVGHAPCRDRRRPPRRGAARRSAAPRVRRRRCSSGACRR